MPSRSGYLWKSRQNTVASAWMLWSLTRQRCEGPQWSCHGGTNQQWRVSSADRAYRLQTVHSGKVSGRYRMVHPKRDQDCNSGAVAERNTDNGARIQQWDCHGGGNQNSKFKQLGGRRSPPQPQAVWKESFEGISPGSRWFDRATEVKKRCGVNGSRCVRVTYVPSSEGQPAHCCAQRARRLRKSTRSITMSCSKNGWDFVGVENSPDWVG